MTDTMPGKSRFTLLPQQTEAGSGPRREAVMKALDGRLMASTLHIQDSMLKADVPVNKARQKNN